jgi:hypothetical protein
MGATKGMVPIPQQRPAMGAGSAEQFDAIVIGAGATIPTLSTVPIGFGVCGPEFG